MVSDAEKLNVGDKDKKRASIHKMLHCHVLWRVVVRVM